jgi:UDP-2,3-diacylglucosamine pyrophosphatase LpxH
MRTAIVSDLHLSSGFGEDMLRDERIRRLFLEQIADADRLVLLGDVVELRERPLADSLQQARSFFEEVGEAMAGRPVVFVPGNHDHRLAEPLLEEAELAGRPLALEQHASPSSDSLERIAAWLGGAELDLAYPGIWLRDDVYATHGHYMDCHMHLPRLECVAAATVMRAFGPLPGSAAPADYERVLRPVYGLSFSLAQSGLAQRATRPSERAWRMLVSRNGAPSRARRALLGALAGVGIPATVWGLNRLLRSEFEPDLSARTVTGSGIAAATEMTERLGVDTAQVITGHTHRAGPAEDEAAWRLPGGGRLHNTGSWVFASAFHHPGTPPGPYWPGTVTWVEDEGAPRRARLLTDHTRGELHAIVQRLSSRNDV